MRDPAAGFAAPIATAPTIRNCGIIATALLIGVDYLDAVTALRDHAKAQGTRLTKGWGVTHAGWTYLSWVEAVSAQLGAPLVEMVNPGGTLLRVSRYLRPGQTYLIRTGGHFQVVRDGLAYDQANRAGTPIASFWGRNKRVTHLLAKREADE